MYLDGRQAGDAKPKSLCFKTSGHSMIPCPSFRRRPESNVIYASTRGSIWAPAFAGATNSSPQRPSMLLTQALTEVASGYVLFYDAGDQLWSLEGDIVNTVFKPDCLSPREQAASLGH